MVATQIALRSYVKGQRPMLSFTLYGTPESQSRPAPSYKQRHQYNRKAKELKTTKGLIKGLLSSVTFDPSENAPSEKGPPFPATQTVRVKATFFLPRPRSHIRRSINGGEDLKTGILTKPRHWSVKKRVDIDNLAKFILDAMNQVVYADDKQVEIMIATKRYDDREAFRGRTVVTVEGITEEMIDEMAEEF